MDYCAPEIYDLGVSGVGCRGGVAGGVVRGARMNVGISEVATAEIDPGSVILSLGLSWQALCSWQAVTSKTRFAALWRFVI